MGKSRVAIVRCERYEREEVDRAVDRLVALLGVEVARPKERVVLKPNLLAPAPPEQAVCTHPEVVGALIRRVREAGAIPFVGDSPNIGGMRYNLRGTGIREVAEAHGAKILSFDRPQRVASRVKIPFFAVDRQVLEADRLINVCKLKSHSQLLLTACVKNLYGCVPGRRKALLHALLGADEEAFARMLLEVYRVVNASLHVVDAVTAMEGNGPKRGTPKKVGLLLAGTDGVAVDRVICEVVGVDPDDVFVLRVARREGIGVCDLAKIEVVGESPEAVRVDAFKLPHLLPINFSPWRLLKGQLRHWRASAG